MGFVTAYTPSLVPEAATEICVRVRLFASYREAAGTARLEVPLRSHGGLSEQRVPLLVNAQIRAQSAARRWRNFDAFDLGLNLAVRAARAA